MREFIEHIKLYNRKQGLSETGDKLKTKVESHRVGIFLNIYNRKNKTKYSISKKQESPDFLAKDSDKYISLEHTGFSEDKKNANENAINCLEAQRQGKNIWTQRISVLAPEDLSKRIAAKDRPCVWKNSKGHKILIIDMWGYNNSVEYFVRRCRKFSFKHENFDSCYLLYPTNINFEENIYKVF